MNCIPTRQIIIKNQNINRGKSSFYLHTCTRTHTHHIHICKMDKKKCKAILIISIIFYLFAYI